MTFLIVALTSYLLGSIPFGLVMARVFGLGDLRNIGSGNIGTTNVLRTGNKPAAFLTLIFDAGKGAIVVLIARQFGGEALAGLAGLFAVLGHNYPIFLRFQGGKGLATFLGTLLALSFPVGAAACATWLLTALIFRFSSLSALTAAVFSPVYAYAFYHRHGAILVLLMSVLVVYKHSENIKRLLNRTELKIGR